MTNWMMKGEEWLDPLYERMHSSGAHLLLCRDDRNPSDSLQEGQKERQFEGKRGIMPPTRGILPLRG
jgi:hypothetical protein